MKRKKVKINERALLGRINRALAKEDRKIHKSRNVQGFLDCGHYYITNKRNLIYEKNIDLEEIGRRLEVLKSYEELEAT